MTRYSRFYKKPKAKPQSINSTNANATVTGSKHACTLFCKPDSLTESTRKMLYDRKIEPKNGIPFDSQEKLERFLKENPGVNVVYPNETPRYTRN